MNVPIYKLGVLPDGTACWSANILLGDGEYVATFDVPAALRAELAQAIGVSPSVLGPRREIVKHKLEGPPVVGLECALGELQRNGKETFIPLIVTHLASAALGLIKCARLNIANRSAGQTAENGAFANVRYSPGRSAKSCDVLIAIGVYALGLEDDRYWSVSVRRTSSCVCSPSKLTLWAGRARMANPDTAMARRAQLVAEWRASGEAKAVFARRHGVHPRTFWCWCREAAGPSPVADTSMPVFVPVARTLTMDASCVDLRSRREVERGGAGAADRSGHSGRANAVSGAECEAHAERFVRSIDEECLDRLIPGLENALIEGAPPRRVGRVHRRQRLGGLLNDYSRAA